jgi:hypothetical protein
MATASPVEVREAAQMAVEGLTAPGGTYPADRTCQVALPKRAVR